jgi:TRAP-type uncharacterized transport system substrate-binding protein
MPENKGKETEVNRMQALLMEAFGLSPAASWVACLVTVVVVVAAIFWFFHSAPPKTITLASGPPGSSFETIALKYQAILKSNGVSLQIVPTAGAEDNLQRLLNPSAGVDVGFVQGGVTNPAAGSHSNSVVSLGSLSYQPMMIFYRGSATMQLLSELKGKRLVIGPPGSGDRALALTLLATNGASSNADTVFVDLDAAAAANALRQGTVDAIFLMGDSASTEVMRALLVNTNIHLYNVVQADGYIRRFTYLSKLYLPRGSFDFGRDIPGHDVVLIGPTVELLARPELHPALSDLLLEAAQQVNGTSGLLRHKGEFPAPLEHDFPISADAQRFYKSGKGFFYRYLPFWLASLVNRILVSFVPMVVILVPAMRIIPALFNWRMQTRIFHWYRSLLALEKDVQLESARTQREKLISRLDEIELAVNKMKVPASFADQFYGLRGHIDFVRSRIMENA